MVEFPTHIEEEGTVIANAGITFTELVVELVQVPTAPIIAYVVFILGDAITVVPTELLNVDERDHV